MQIIIINGVADHYEWLLLLCKFTRPSLESLKVIRRLESQGSMSKGLGSLRSTLPEIREQEGIEREIRAQKEILVTVEALMLSNA